MSQTLELPDEIHAALRRAAEVEGMTPVDWISARLASGAPTSDPTTSMNGPRTLADQFAGRIGRIRSAGRGDLSQETGGKFADYLEEKKQAGHL